MIRHLHVLALSSAALLLGACASTAPAPQPYKAELAANFANADATQAEPVGEFWRAFGDVDLDALIERAAKANADIRIAAATLNEARALSQFSDAQLLPSVDLTAAAARVRNRDDQGQTQRNNVFSAGFDVAWEADLFGRLRSDRQAAAATVLAGEAGVRAAQVSVAAEVARNYFELRGLQEQLRVAKASLETQQAALKLVQARQSVGRGTAFDTERASALVQTTAAAVPALEAAAARTRYRIAVLTGQTPSAVDVTLSANKPLPGLKSVALGNIGSPESLLRRRPDVAVAEAQLAAAAARVGVARSALFPRITLGGTIGLNAGRVSDLGDSSAFVYNLGANLLWSLLDFGRVRAQITASEARSEAAAISYEKAVLGALEETEGALSTYNRTQQQSDSLFSAAQSASKAAEIARARFDVGSSDFLAVLDAERELLAARDRLAQAQTAAALSVVGVYKALAGGWTAPR
jgi:multidrug efflux system outer membrane protein